ncbi:MAG: hypothetical protein N3G20_05675 [Verrucomicrobiae bacterium]|nr:hypothetical protein [Verrucomicrobiae bacterium]
MALSRPEPDVLYVRLRDRVLTGTASDLKLEGHTNSSPLWGLVVEHGLPRGTATLVCLANGEANLYLSTGSGLAGTSTNPSIRAAASNLVLMASKLVSTAIPAESFPQPGVGEVLFWFLTTNQVLGTQASERDLESQDHPLRQLYTSANTLLTEMHLTAKETLTHPGAGTLTNDTESPKTKPAPNPEPR